MQMEKKVSYIPWYEGLSFDNLDVAMVYLFYTIVTT